MRALPAVTTSTAYSSAQLKDEEDQVSGLDPQGTSVTTALRARS